MLRMLSPSTGSESLRPRHVFLPCESDAKSYRCDIFHQCTSVICYSVNIARAYTSAGPLSLKQNGVFHMSYHIGLHQSAHCALIPLAATFRSAVGLIGYTVLHRFDCQYAAEAVRSATRVPTKLDWMRMMRLAKFPGGPQRTRMALSGAGRA